MLNLADIQTEAKQIINEAIYLNYVFNRKNSPPITPEQWGKIYPNVEELERRYISENN